MCFDCDRDEISRRSFLAAAAATAASLALPPPSRGDPAPARRALDDPKVAHADVTYPNGAASIAGFLARPRDARRHPALFVLHGDPGLPDWVRDCAARLAQAGFVALVMDIGSDPAIQKRPSEYYGSSAFDQQVAVDARAGFAYLQSQPFTKSGGLGMVGFCFGGRMALLVPFEAAAVKVAVVFYGPARDRVSRNATDPKPHVIDLAARITIPVQGHYGTLDTVAQQADARELEQVLKAQRTPVEMHYYEGAGHGFYGNTWQEQTPEFGYNGAAAKLAHERMLRFLKRHLG
jgi:carboxymethylenebutenolidase